MHPVASMLIHIYPIAKTHQRYRVYPETKHEFIQCPYCNSISKVYFWPLLFIGKFCRNCGARHVAWNITLPPFYRKMKKRLL